MTFRVPKAVRFLVALVHVLFFAGAAQAQRIPEGVIWFAGAGLFAPFAAVPVKAGLLRLRSLEAEASLLWTLSAIEWVLWFPVGFLSLRFGRSPPLIVLVLLISAVWLHRTRVANASWSSALALSLPTPFLALVLPVLALAAAALVESVAG